MIPSDANEDSNDRTIDQIADQLQLLIQRCRLISLRADNIHIAAELMDLATLLDYEVERLRTAVVRSIH